MRAFLICLMTVGLVVSSARARDDGGDKQSSEKAEGNANPAHDADANRPANEVVPSKLKDASLAAEIQQLRDLVQSQAREWELQRAALRKAIGEQQQEIENLRQELQVSRSGSASVAAERTSVLLMPISATSSAPAVQSVPPHQVRPPNRNRHPLFPSGLAPSSSLRAAGLISLPSSVLQMSAVGSVPLSDQSHSRIQLRDN